MSRLANLIGRTGRVVLPVIFLIVFLINLSLGSVHVRITKIFSLLFESENSTERYLIWNLRFPRVLMATLTGIALSTVGNVFQAIMKNPLVDPYIVGTSAGASFGALLAIYFTVNSIAHISIPLMSFLFAIFASFLTIFLAKKNGIIPIIYLVLSGVLVSTMFSAGSMLLLNIANKTLVSGHVWLYGTFSGMTISDTLMPAVSLSLFLISAFIFSKHLDAMTLGEKEARSLGVNVEFVKWYFYLLGSFVTATFVSKTGIIGFVGLIVPHMARILFGPKFKKNLIGTILIGGIFLSLCDTISRTILNPVEIPVGIVTSLIGAPFMFWLLKSRK
ncbi:MAG: FecCD family ABC transporter permease [Fervidobacterium sp.]